MTQPRVQIPQSYNIIGMDGKLSSPWYFFFQNFTENLPPSGAGTVIDGSNETYGQMTAFQGLDSEKGPAENGYIYYALDTGKIYVALNGAWQAMIPEYTGDITNDVYSDVLELKKVNFAPGNYGSSTQIPRFEVDEKGRVTNVTLEPISGVAAAAGGATQIQFNYGGELAASALFTFDPNTNTLTFPDAKVTGVIAFDNPLPTFNNLSPLTTKGDLLGRTATSNVRLPVGTDTQVLTADSTEAAGVKWTNSGKSEFNFDYGDATPKPLITIPANKVVEQVSIIIKTPFDDLSSTLSIGDSGDANRLLSTTDNLPGMAGTYSTEPAYYYGTDTNISLFITPGVSTQGSGVVVIQYQR